MARTGFDDVRKESVVHFYDLDPSESFDLRISYIFGNGTAIGEIIFGEKRETIELRRGMETHLHGGARVYNGGGSEHSIEVKIMLSCSPRKYLITHQEDR